MNLIYGVKDEAFKATRGNEKKTEICKLFQNMHMDLTAVRNQSAAFQVLLYAEEGFLLNVSESTCFDKRGITNAIRLKTVFNEDVQITSNMNIIGFVEDDDRLLKADILLAQEDIYVEKGVIQPVWVEFQIPEDLKAGAYNGRVIIYRNRGFEQEYIAGEVTFKLIVKDVSLPMPSEYKFYLDLWQHNSNIARKHEVPLWGDRHFEVLEKYIESLACLGQKAISIVASEVPWSGQFCYRHTEYLSNLFEYSIIKVVKEQNGELSVDFTSMDRYIDLCFKYGIRQEIEVFGLINIWMCEEEGFGKVIKDFSDGIRVRYLDKSDNCYKYIDSIRDLKDYIKKVEGHFIQRGLIDKVRVIADEPSDLDMYNQRLDFLRKVAPSFKYKAAINSADFIQKFNLLIDDFVPIFTVMCSENEKVRELKYKVKGKVSWYVCCGPDLPNTFVKSHIAESYCIGWLTEYMHLDGFLRWNYTVWPEKPRDRISYRMYAPDTWSAGDTNFVYPSYNGAPLLTLRYKALLKGIQTFELIAMLKGKNPRAQEYLEQAYAKIFKFNNINAFQYDKYCESIKKIDELLSLEYNDYVEALDIIIRGILSE